MIIRISSGIFSVVRCDTFVVHFSVALSLSSHKKKGELFKYVTRELFVHSVLVVCAYIFSVLFVWYTLQTYKIQTWYQLHCL